MPSSFARVTACPRPFIVARNPTMWSRRAARSLTKPSSSTSTAVPFAGTSSVCLLHPSCRRAHQDTRSRAPFSRRASSRAVPRLRHPSIRPLWDGVPVAQSAAARLVLTSHPRGRVRHASPTCTDVRHATRTAAHSSPARHRTRRAHPSHLLRPAGRPTPPHPLHGGTRVARRTPYALRPRGTPRSLVSRRSLHPALRASHV